MIALLRSSAGVATPTNAPRASLGQFAPIALSTGVGILLCSVADALSRATVGPAMTVYWLGMLVLALPIFFRLTSRDASAAERLALVCALGVALYLVKVVRDAPSFTFSDELIHAFNANQIVNHDHLFQSNPVLKVTPFYPGLEGATSALMTITGLSSYTAGVIVAGVARLGLISALFLLFRRISGSARTAGLAAAIYTANFNFLFWGAQYSYESLALPLLVVLMMMLAERESTPRKAIREWAAPLVLAIAAIVVTHHLTSYAAVAVLVALSLALWLLKRTWRPPNAWPYAALAAALALFWLFVVAGSTVSYLSTPLSGALDAISNTIGGDAPPRGLFQGASTDVGVTPFGARAIALLAVALLLIALPFGLLRVWRRYRTQPFALIFMVAALGFFLTLALRLAPAAWEAGNRASEFFFVGLAFVVASAGLQNLNRPTPRLARLLLTAAFGVILVGGAISGWPWDSQLARPLRIAAGDGKIVSQPLAMAEWAREQIPGGRFAAATADANLLLVPGGKAVLTGPSPDVEDTLRDPTLANWQLQMLRNRSLRYVVADRRVIAADGLRGYYFSLDNTSAGNQLLPKSAVTKFEAVPGAARIYSNGAIAVYDMDGKP